MEINFSGDVFHNVFQYWFRFVWFIDIKTYSQQYLFIKCIEIVKIVNISICVSVF